MLFTNKKSEPKLEPLTVKKEELIRYIEKESYYKYEGPTIMPAVIGIFATLMTIIGIASYYK